MSRSGAERPSTIVGAVALTLVTAVVGELVILFGGPEGVKAASIIACAVSMALHLLAAWGLWNLRRWGAIFTVVLAAIDVLTSLPFPFDDVSAWFKVATVIFLAIEVTVLVLMALPGSRGVFRKA